MNISQDKRVLNARCTLQIMQNPNASGHTGEYSGTENVAASENIEPINGRVSSSSANGQKFSKNLRALNALKSGKIPVVNTAPSASSCTFAYGGLVPGESHPVFTLLKGPSETYNPEFEGTVEQSTISALRNSLVNAQEGVPFIPFSGTTGKSLVSYNIWYIDTADKCVKYKGPNRKDKPGSINTINDPAGGCCIEASSVGQKTLIKRLFPTSKDAVYDQSAKLILPDARQIDIKTTGAQGGNSFHINLSLSNMNTESSSVTVYLAQSVKDKNYINDFKIILKLNEKPRLEYFDHDLNKYIFFNLLESPVLDITKAKSFDIYVHFAGPNLLLGFVPDPSKWNSMIPTTSRVSNSEAQPTGKEIYLNKESYISMELNNCNAKFRYSALMFNNFNSEQTGAKANGININFVTSTDVDIPKIFEHFEKAGYRLNSSPGTIGFNTSNPIDKNISYYADHRLVGKQFFANLNSTNEKDLLRKNTSFTLFYNTTIEGPVFLQIETPHPSVSSNTGFDTFPLPKIDGLLVPIPDGILTPFLKSWTVQCNALLTNMSRIYKTATVILSNLDLGADLRGVKLLSLIESNMFVLTLEAGYGSQMHTYFQGFITNVKYERKGSESIVTLSCEDVGSYTLSNIYFEQQMLIGGMQTGLAIDQIINSSGFIKYYDRIPGSLKPDFDLRLNTNSTNNQELIKITPVDDIMKKLTLILERLSSPDKLPIFRWVENQGFRVECRNDITPDTDLKFTGFVEKGARTGLQFEIASNSNNTSNANLQAIPDWHGLLVDSFEVNTDLRTLASGVKTFGQGITGFFAAEDFDLDRSFVNLANAGVIPSIENMRSGYVGFRKYLISSLKSNIIPDNVVLQKFHDIYVKLAQIPIHSIEFTCYVTKPLTFHGTFKINILDSGKVTDQYIYKSINYIFNKQENIITASVSGVNTPMLLGELQK
jgi:hypothetical protein